LYQGSARDYKALFEISKDFPLVLSASQRVEQQLISRFIPTRIFCVSRNGILDN